MSLSKTIFGSQYAFNSQSSSQLFGLKDEERELSEVTKKSHGGTLSNRNRLKNQPS